MSTRVGGRGYLVQEDRLLSDWEWIDSDSDTDSEKRCQAEEMRGELGWRDAYRAKHTDHPRLSCRSMF